MVRNIFQFLFGGEDETGSDHLAEREEEIRRQREIEKFEEQLRRENEQTWREIEATEKLNAIERYKQNIRDKWGDYPEEERGTKKGSFVTKEGRYSRLTDEGTIAKWNDKTQTYTSKGKHYDAKGRRVKVNLTGLEEDE